MTEIVTATLVVGLIGLLIGIALVTMSRRFHVDVDEREAKVRESLPGNNCGACGYAGCDAMAAAVVKGEAAVNACPVNTDAGIAAISAVMGVEAEAAVRKVAFVRCAGDCAHTSVQCNYVGIPDCRAAALAGITVWSCSQGCLGFGSCVKACQYGALRVVSGVAVVDADKCRGCGQCAQACPKGLIELIPAEAPFAVACSSTARGPEVKNVCTAGCIGCRLCTRQCEGDAVTVEANLAHIDYDKCRGCGQCAQKCPSHAIVSRS